VEVEVGADGQASPPLSGAAAAAPPAGAVFINPPLEVGENIGHHFESCRRTAPTSTIVVFVLPKWAKFTELTRHQKLYQEFVARTQLFTRQLLENPTKQEVVVPTP
jgi:hypothetical protein